MSKPHIQLRRGILPHLKQKKMTMPEFSVYCYLHLIVDFRTGVCVTSAPHIYYDTDGLGSIRKTQRIMENLEKKEYIRRFTVPGKRGDYSVLIHKYQPTFGAWTGQYLNALDSESSEALQFTDDAESDVRRDAREGGRNGEYVYKSGKKSDKNLEKKCKEKIPGVAGSPILSEREKPILTASISIISIEEIL